MPWNLLFLFDLIGTIAFAISGAFVAIRKGMDIFGVNVLAVTTACGGGLMRDLIIGSMCSVLGSTTIVWPGVRMRTDVEWALRTFPSSSRSRSPTQRMSSWIM